MEMIILLCSECNSKIFLKNSTELKEILEFGCLCDDCLQKLFDDSDISDEFKNIN